MPLTQSDIDNFHLFASQELSHCNAGQDLEDLVEKWRLQREKEETLASIQRGVEDAEAGRLQELGKVGAKFRESLGFPAHRR